MHRVLVILLLAVATGCGHIDDGPRSISDPISEFTNATGLSLPSTSTVVNAADTHGGFHGDGELYLVFKTNLAIVEDWLTDVPPWKQKDWLAGPVPPEISSHCLHAPTTGMNSAEVRYIAEDFKLSSIPWHNGRLLVVNPNTGEVTLSWWDF